MLQISLLITLASTSHMHTRVSCAISTPGPLSTTGPQILHSISSRFNHSTDSKPSLIVDSHEPKSTARGVKRGLPYNDANMTECFFNSSISWAYNWDQARNGLSDQFDFVPMLWSGADSLISHWVANAQASIDEGSSALLAFNEPDLQTQANMTPPHAATVYKNFVHDKFANSGISLGSPAVTNGAPPMGITWLNQFLDYCSDCQIDFVVIHWYGLATDINYFKAHVREAYNRTKKAIWITEFGASGSDEEVQIFLQNVMPWLDQEHYVQRYAYFMAGDGLLNNGSAMSTYGRVYAT